MRSFVLLPFIVSTSLMLILASFLDGCCRGPLCNGTGGGEDMVEIDLPFAEGYTAACVQGAGGAYSHQYASTAYDVDFDTPNDRRDPLYAPLGGVAYVHDDDREGGFGVHVNIDIGDGTYILLAHMDEVFVDDGSDVAEGQLIGFEGTTGYSTGDHVHIGRHDGDPAADATLGASVEGLSIRLHDASTGGGSIAVSTSALTCDLSFGHRYVSELETPAWHPDGTLVKTPDVSTVYLLDDGDARAFMDETAFWSRGYDFDDVALVSDEELACYGVGSDIASEADVGAVFDDGVVWLVIEDGAGAARYRVSSFGWQGVLKSWGIAAATYDDLPSGESSAAYAASSEVGMAPFREGSLVSEVSSSAVYVMSDGVAMPIETWEVFVLMGFEDRTVIEVDDGAVNAVMGAVGDCATNAYCVSRDDVVTCGGPSSEEAAYPERVEDDDDTVASEAGGVGDDTAQSNALSLTWTTPDGMPAESILLSGEYTRAGGRVESWRNIAEATDAATLAYTLSDVVFGDSLRFSVEFVQDGDTSWSCLAPYPPGTVRGTAEATWNGTALAVTPADDPSSDGCGLVVTVE